MPHRNRTEAAIAILEAGVDVNCLMDDEGLTLLISAAWSGNPDIMKSLATSPGIMLDAQVSGCEFYSVLRGYCFVL